MYRYLLIGFVAFFLTQALLAQEGLRLDSIDYNKLEIPPLAVLFENARKSPAVELYQAKMDEQASLLKTEKRSWLKYFKVGGSWQYGRMGVTSAFSDQSSPLFYSFSGVRQNSYYGSASISIPLDDFFDRKNRIKRQQMATVSTQLEIEKWHDEQKLRIIEVYTKVLKDLKLLKLKAQSVTFANAQFETSLNDFKNGNIKIGDLNTAKSIQMTATESYEGSKAELNEAILQMEVLSRTKIISK